MKEELLLKMQTCYHWGYTKPFALVSLWYQLSSWKGEAIQENGQYCLDVWRLQLKLTSEREHVHLGKWKKGRERNDQGKWEKMLLNANLMVLHCVPFLAIQTFSFPIILRSIHFKASRCAGHSSLTCQILIHSAPSSILLWAEGTGLCRPLQPGSLLSNCWWVPPLWGRSRRSASPTQLCLFLYQKPRVLPGGCCQDSCTHLLSNFPHLLTHWTRNSNSSSALLSSLKPIQKKCGPFVKLPSINSFE